MGAPRHPVQILIVHISCAMVVFALHYTVRNHLQKYGNNIAKSKTTKHTEPSRVKITQYTHWKCGKLEIQY